jgi:serine protease Do
MPHFVLSTEYLVLCISQSRSLHLASVILLLFAAPAVTQDTPPSPSAPTLLPPQAFRAAAANIEPSLVRIEAFGGIAPGSDNGGYHAPGEGPTTGLVISPDGFILTSTFNFLRKPPIITVVFADGRRHVAKLLGRDETRKICVLKVDGVSNLPIPAFASRDELKVGQWAIALGVGFGAKEPVISAGIISATSRVSGKAIQTDANTSPANYGGPLLDSGGRVIGICVPLNPGSQQEAAGSEWYDSGIGFAIPLDGLAPVLDRLKAGETLRHPFLGVQTEPHGDPPSGAMVKEVVPNSPAAKGGLAAGDKIITVGGIQILDATHLATVIRRYVAGDKADLVIDRAGKNKTLTAELTFPPSLPQTPPQPNTKAGDPREPKPGPAKPPPQRAPM